MTLTESSACNIPIGSEREQKIKGCVLIVWDECSMSNRFALEALDRYLRGIRFNESVMGGTTVVLSGDFRQVLPIVPGGREEDRIDACFKQSRLMDHVIRLPLHRDMRARLQEDAEEAERFSTLLVEIGEGRFPSEFDQIQIPSRLGTPVASLERLVERVYPDSREWRSKPGSWWSSRCILASTRDLVYLINNFVLDRMDGEQVELSKVVEAINIEYGEEEPDESPEFPLENMVLKQGAVVILLRSLYHQPGLLNGTRLRVIRFEPNELEAEILTGPAAGGIAHVPRLPFWNIPGSQEMEAQFPVKLCFAMTIHKSLGQSLSTLGLDLTVPFFTHGQLYTACSQVASSKKLFYLVKIHPSLKCYFTRNVVYPQVLNWVKTEKGSPVKN